METVNERYMYYKCLHWSLTTQSPLKMTATFSNLSLPHNYRKPQISIIICKSLITWNAKHHTTYSFSKIKVNSIPSLPYQYFQYIISSSVIEWLKKVWQSFLIQVWHLMRSLLFLFDMSFIRWSPGTGIDVTASISLPNEQEKRWIEFKTFDKETLWDIINNSRSTSGSILIQSKEIPFPLSSQISWI